ncbi:uncharacterized protein EV420DRAFT_1753815 [Desarmillaria tabescens]|uniref:Uncharacterized protein n=1 Tax=Armillaria tabescens TaxID=1929756 RepID=A0AA39MJX3_ARMTA|nr:uncharacterized protein EV420DRAFT_1753815 [Desarmillaria tabescens]KAK0436175.1 hypothetical protein EV420DRAFT_1753815 [Desarmillaria tabescens]
MCVCGFGVLPISPRRNVTSCRRSKHKDIFSVLMSKTSRKLKITDIPKDTDKPDGEAVNPDTLKTVDQIVWEYSPTSSPVTEKRSLPKRNFQDVESNETSAKKRQKTALAPMNPILEDTSGSKEDHGTMPKADDACDESEMEGKKRY